MKIDLKKYMTERDEIRSHKGEPGPVITISREHGCGANRIAHLLIKKINEYPVGPMKKLPWKFVSKEILEESARDLGLKPEEVDRLVTQHEPKASKSIFSAFSSHYNVKDEVVLEKVKEIIETYASRGNMIIIGRGGASVVRHMKNSLHIKLFAREEWRADYISRMRDISKDEALKLNRHFDESRHKWMDHLAEGQLDNSAFDLWFNVERISEKEIVQAIFDILEQRGYVFGEIKSEKSRAKSLV